MNNDKHIHNNSNWNGADGKEIETKRNSHSALAVTSGNNETIEKGNTLLGIYTIESDAIVGGMGHVFKVHHTVWNRDLAMKHPRMEQFQNENQKAYFNGECKKWIDLGLHYHVVSCFYVRKVDGIPCAFAEWMDGGSLKDWIYPKKNGSSTDKGKKGRLYEGGKEKTLERILNICIQFTRGLQYAHEKGLIHKDVKPGNLLLTVDGSAKVLTAKVADFGLSSVKTVRVGTEEEDAVSADSPVGGTQAYYSPEQKSGEKELTLHTDIWSWAVSVLEMFTGKCIWTEGTVAGYNCDYYFTQTKAPVPEAMKDLLRWCFMDEIADRPKDFGVVEAELLKIYQAETGSAYLYPKIKAVSLFADSLNNHALSFIDMGQPEEAEKCWEKALKADPNSAISQYNFSIYLWNNAVIDDLEVMRRYTSVSTRDMNYYHYLAKLHIARGDAESAIECLNKATAMYGVTDDYQTLLLEAQRMIAKHLDGRCIRTFDNIKPLSVCFSSDGKQALVGRGIMVERWNLETGECAPPMKGHKSYVEAVCLSPDGQQALSGSSDCTVKLWDLEKRTCRLNMAGHTNVVQSVCFSPDGQFALSGSADCTLRLWDLKTGDCIRPLPGHTGSVRSICFSPDGKTAISGSTDRTVKFWDLESGDCVNTLDDMDYEVNTVNISPDAKRALTGGDLSVEVWDTKTYKYIRSLEGHTNIVQSVCFSPDATKAISGGWDHTVKLWDVETGKCLRTFVNGEDNMLNVRPVPEVVYFDSNGSRIFSGSSATKVKIWHVPHTNTPGLLLGNIQSFDAIVKESEQFHSLVAEIEQLVAQKEIASALNKLNMLRRINSFASSEAYYTVYEKLASYCISKQLNRYALRIFPAASDYVWDFYWSESRHIRAITGGKNELMKVWNLTTDISLYHAFSNFCSYAACISPNGSIAFFNVDENYDSLLEVMIWNISGDQPVFLSRRLLLCKFHAVCFSPDGRTVFIGTEDGIIQAWSLETGEFIRYFKGHTDCVVSLCCSPDGRLLISGSDDKTVKLWDFSMGICIHTLKNVWISAINISLDGKMAVLGDRNGTITLWNLETNEFLHTLAEHTEEIKSVSFSPDSRLMLSGSADRTVKLWDVKTGKCIKSFNIGDCVQKVCFSPSGQQIAIAYKNIIHIYDLDFDLHFPGWHSWNDSTDNNTPCNCNGSADMHDKHDRRDSVDDNGWQDRRDLADDNGLQDWQEGARSYLDIFLTLHPDWTDDDFNNILLPTLKNCGYGWLCPEGIRTQLEHSANT